MKREGEDSCAPPAKVRRQEGEELAAEGKYREALDKWDGLHDDSGELHEMRAQVHLELGEYDKAVAAGRKAVDVSRGEWVPALVTYGRALVNYGEWREGRTVLERARELAKGCEVGSIDDDLEWVRGMMHRVESTKDAHQKLTQLSELVAPMCGTPIWGAEPLASTLSSPPQPAAAERRVPVTVLSGFLGAGKTTIVNALLKKLRGTRVAVIVNDMSEVAIDSDDIAGCSTVSDTKVVEVAGGCICCTRRDDLIKQVGELLTTYPDLEYLVVESTGMAESLPVAQTFTVTSDLPKRVRLDTLVTVVDGSTFAATVKDEKEDGTSSLAQLLTDQVEFANVIVITKTDLAPPDTVVGVEQLVKAINPAAKVLTCSHGDVDPREIINTRLFCVEGFASRRAWQQELEAPHVPETDAYGITSFTWQCVGGASRPFHAVRLAEVLARLARKEVSSGPFRGVIRAKGWFWLAPQPDLKYLMSFSLSGLKTLVHGRWSVVELADLTAAPLADTTAEGKRKDAMVRLREEEEALRQAGAWADEYGDRRQVLVFIGKANEVDRAAVEKMLEGALLSDEELSLGKTAWSRMANPFHSIRSCSLHHGSRSTENE